MLTVAAFVVALGLLIAVHEYGHYRVAVACGVKVIRFSIGFGKSVFKWVPRGSETEFTIGLIPLGGFVKMLDEREGAVAPDERHRAFNTQPLKSRAAIVAAGPVANLVLAILLYASVNWLGIEQARAVLAQPASGTLAERAGLVGGERVLAGALAGESFQDVVSFETLRWLLIRATLASQDLELSVADRPGSTSRVVHLQTGGLDVREVNAALFDRIGITGPLTAPVIGEISPNGAAARDGLQKGDLVLAVGHQTVVDGQQLRRLIRASGQTGLPTPNTWSITRQGQAVGVDVKPDVKSENGQNIGWIGAYVGAPPETLVVQLGLLDGLQSAMARTWEISILTLRTMGRMVVGEASLKNLSGPLTIADYAGKSAGLGLQQYLLFLALISVSLGVLNLLPLPVLDGGHLMYYLWEGITGRAVSMAWMDRLQRGGAAILALMMSIALYNDFSRLLG